MLGNVDAGPCGGPTSFAYAPDGRILVGFADASDNGVNQGDEAFTVTLSNASGASIAQAVGTGAIIDDE